MILSVIKGLSDAVIKNWQELKKIFEPYLVILPSQINKRWWRMGKLNKKLSMQVVGGWCVTNKSDKPLRVLNVYLQNPKIMGTVLTRKVASNLYGAEFTIPPYETTDLAVNFLICPPLRKEREVFKSNIIFVDQYGKKIVLKNVEFPYL